MMRSRFLRSILPALAPCMALAPSAGAQEVLYFLDGYISPTLWTMDPASGALLTSNPVTGAEALFGGLTLGTDGNLYSIDGYNDGNSDRLFVIDPATGNGKVVGETGFNWNFRNVALDPSTGTLYGATDNNLFVIDQATGAAKLVGPITAPTLDQLTALAIDDAGNAYFTDIGDTGLFALDLSTGSAKHLGNLGQSGNWFDDLDFDAAGTLWGGRTAGGLFTIDIDAVKESFKFSGIFRGLAFSGGDDACYPDFDGNGALDLFDFLQYINEFDAGADRSDCDNSGSLDFFDFLCFTNAFNEGC